jgi:hypothetical protein
MRSMQCKVEFGYQLSICSGTTENLDRVGRSQDLPDANRLLANSPALNTRALTLVPICDVFSFFEFFLSRKLFLKLFLCDNLDTHQTVYNTYGKNEHTHEQI